MVNSGQFWSYSGYFLRFLRFARPYDWFYDWFTLNMAICTPTGPYVHPRDHMYTPGTLCTPLGRYTANVRHSGTVPQLTYWVGLGSRSGVLSQCTHGLGPGNTGGLYRYYPCTTPGPIYPFLRLIPTAPNYWSIRCPKRCRIGLNVVNSG